MHSVEADLVARGTPPPREGGMNRCSTEDLRAVEHLWMIL